MALRYAPPSGTGSALTGFQQDNPSNFVLLPEPPYAEGKSVRLSQQFSLPSVGVKAVSRHGRLAPAMPTTHYPKPSNIQ